MVTVGPTETRTWNQQPVQCPFKLDKLIIIYGLELKEIGNTYTTQVPLAM